MSWKRYLRLHCFSTAEGSQLDIDTRLALADSVTEWKLWSTFFWKAAKEQIKIPPIPVGFCSVDTMMHASGMLNSDHEACSPSWLRLAHAEQTATRVTKRRQ